MPKCVKISRKKRTVCAGDMRDTIIIETRVITAPQSGSVDFSETFTNTETVWALIETRSGIQEFADVNLDARASHLIYIRFIADVTFQNWLTFKGKRYEILDVENLEERDEFYLLRCSPLGDQTLPTNFSR